MVCKFVDDTRDAAAFELAHARHGSFNNMRTLYTQHLRMKKGAWDEGWGLICR